MGLLGRHAINTLGAAWIFILTFVDDLHIAAGGRDGWAYIWRFIAAMEMAGTPFSYKKFTGGFTLVCGLLDGLQPVRDRYVRATHFMADCIHR